MSENMEVLQSASKTGFKIQIFTHQPAHQPHDLAKVILCWISFLTF